MNKYIDLLNPEAMPRRYEIFTQMREQDPVYFFDADFFQSWFITSFEDVAALLHDNRLSTSNTLVHLASAPAEEQTVLAPLKHYMQHALPEISDERHKVLQTFFLQYFSPKVIKTLEDRIYNLVKELADTLDTSTTINFCADFAYPLPAMVIADILGVPKEGFNNIIKWSESLIELFRPYNFELYQKGQSDLLSLIQYAEELMDSSSLREDSLLAALKIEIDNGTILKEEALINCANILFAGHETTASALSKGLWELFEHPQALTLLHADMELLPNAIEEIIRKVGIVGWLMRRAEEDIEYKGFTFKKGQRLMLSPFSANLDAQQFANPLDFDIQRSNAKQHIGFGKGKHYCLGANLARLELRIAFKYLLEKFPNYHIDADNIETGTLNFLNYSGLKKLPVKLKP